jgi:hypothetical protein
VRLQIEDFPGRSVALPALKQACPQGKPRPAISTVHAQLASC